MIFESLILGVFSFTTLYGVKFMQKRNITEQIELLSSQKKYSLHPARLLIFISLISFWKLGVIFFAFISFPFEKQLPPYLAVLIFIFGLIFSILLMLKLPQTRVILEQSILYTALATILMLFCPFGGDFASAILYVHLFFCSLAQGFEIVNIIFMFSEANALIYLSSVYGLASVSTIIFKTLYTNITFSQFQIVTLICLILILTLSRRLALDTSPETTETVIEEIIDEPIPVNTSFSSRLTKREMDVVSLINNGYTNAEIAEELIISIHTVNDHTKNIYRKLDVHSRYELIALLNQKDSV